MSVVLLSHWRVLSLIQLVESNESPVANQQRLNFLVVESTALVLFGRHNVGLSLYSASRLATQRC